MLKFIYHIYFFKFSNSEIDSYYKRICIRLSNLVLSLYYRLTSSITSKRKLEKKSNPELIVSLTSYPARIGKVWTVIETLLDQTTKPDAIILWLYKGEINNDEEIPERLIKIQKRGLEIRYCDKNLMPHKKYIYTMREYPDSIVITVDDDMLFPPDLIENLIDCHKKYPEAICCSILRQIKIEAGEIRPYQNWNHLLRNTPPEFRNHVMGGGGTLFPAGSLHPEVFNTEAIEKLALRTDDLWLKAMSLKQNTKVASIAGEYPRYFIPIIYDGDNPLMDKNIDENVNDKNFAKIICYYNMEQHLKLLQLSKD